MSRARTTATIIALLAVLGVFGVPIIGGAQTPPDADAGAVGATPPRLSFVDGQVSLWRPGAEDWTAARVNTPLVPGDALYTGSPGSLEVQVAGRAYVRAWASTQFALASVEPDFVQLQVTAGHVALDIRRLDPGHTVEVDTPNAAFTIERAGYYRVNVRENRTSFVTRRGGRATVTPANGTAAAVAPSEEVIVEGTDSPTVATYVAPELDAWDRWNYARTEALIDSVSARYVSADIYGVDDLDHHGSWRVVETYGPVWVPTGVPAGWAPYTTGAWTWDPYYGWTWVDTAPWGWAPYHYGRWVFVSGVWAWAPGAVIARPVYAPALVAFLGPRVGVSIGVGPAVGWVALGWGEPLIPWWGPVGFVGVPWWAGWGGPRIVNNVVITATTVVHAHEINVHRNVGARNAVVVIPRERFGRGPVTRARVARVDPTHLEPVRGKLEVAPGRASLTPDAVRGARPPKAIVERGVVATRAPEDPARRLERQGIAAPSRAPSPPPRLVPAPPRGTTAEVPPRPPFGASKIERPQPPRPQRAQPPSAGGPAVSRPQPSRPTPAPGRPAAPSRPAPSAPGAQPRPTPPAPGAQPRPAPPAARVEPAPAPPRVEAPRERLQPPGTRQAPRPQVRPLPGEPANRLFPGRVKGGPGQR